jgi:hypothetical protein
MNTAVSAQLPLPLSIELAQPVLDTFEIDVTPAFAQVLLKLNRRNRVIRHAWVAELAARMRRGEWKVTHQGLAVSDQQVLLDGQHRLLAVVAANMTVRMRITYDADPDTFDALDMGAKRNLSDLTGSPKHVVEVATRLARMVMPYHPTPAQLGPYLDAFTGAIEKLHAACPTYRRYSSAANVRAAAVLAMLAQPQHEQYVLDNYRNLVLMQLSAAPPVFSALMRHLSEGDTTSDDAFVRSYYAFAPKHGKFRRIQIKNFDADRAKLRAAISAVLSA